MNNYKQILFAILIVLGMSNILLAQDTTAVNSAAKAQNVAAKDKIYYGGNIGLSFGNYTMVAIRPLIAYKVTPKLSAGVRLSYEYVSDKRFNTTYNTSNYGASVFSRYRIIPQIYAHAEYAALNYELYDELGRPVSHGFRFSGIGHHLGGAEDDTQRVLDFMGDAAGDVGPGGLALGRQQLGDLVEGGDEAEHHSPTLGLATRREAFDDLAVVVVLFDARPHRRRDLLRIDDHVGDVVQALRTHRAAVLVAEQVVGSRFDEGNKVQYTINGGWDSPVVERLPTEGPESQRTPEELITR